MLDYKPVEHETLSVGARVKARYQGGAWYPGKVSAVHPDGAYAVEYDDGDKEASVPPHMVKPIP